MALQSKCPECGETANYMSASSNNVERVSTYKCKNDHRWRWTLNSQKNSRELEFPIGCVK